MKTAMAIFSAVDSPLKLSSDQSGGWTVANGDGTPSAASSSTLCKPGSISVFLTRSSWANRCHSTAHTPTSTIGVVNDISSCIEINDFTFKKHQKQLYQLYSFNQQQKIWKKYFYSQNVKSECNGSELAENDERTVTTSQKESKKADWWNLHKSLWKKWHEAVQNTKVERIANKHLQTNTDTLHWTKDSPEDMWHW